MLGSPRGCSGVRGGASPTRQGFCWKPRPALEVVCPHQGWPQDLQASEHSANVRPWLEFQNGASRGSNQAQALLSMGPARLCS